jgi:hypothetical protein
MDVQVRERIRLLQHNLVRAVDNIGFTLEVLGGRGERASCRFPEVLLVDCEDIVLQRDNL